MHVALPEKVQLYIYQTEKCQIDHFLILYFVGGE